MWQSKMFTEDQMVAWENKAATRRHGQSSRPTSPKMAGMQTILRHDGKAVMFQRGSASHTGDSSAAEVGAVLIKKYSSYCMKQKKLHVFFLQFLTY